MPQIKLTSYGAAGEVTGSCHLLQIGRFKLLIDCGLFQGSESNFQKNFEAFGFDPKTINAVFLTHAHLDHCGRLPKLYANGYRGSVYTTAATGQLAQIVLDDNFYIMREKLARHKELSPYSLADVNKLYKHWEITDYYQSKTIAPNINFTFHNAGHILGSAILEIKTPECTIVFTGDLGAKNMPLVKNVDYLSQADYIITESTYGDRQHENTDKRNGRLLEAVKKTTLKNSVLLISVFAIERTQDVLRVLNDYYETHLDFRVPVYLDSPMAAQATQVYRHHKELLNQDAKDDLVRDSDIFNFPYLKITNQISQSKDINFAPTPKIILAGSGMAEGGRILHHLARYAPDKKNTILFMGYQVTGTLGSRLTNGAFDFHYYQKIIKVRAGVERLDAFSAHADQTDLLEWLSHFQKPKRIFLSHGDPTVMPVFANKITKDLGWPVKILVAGQTETLE